MTLERRSPNGFIRTAAAAAVITALAVPSAWAETYTESITSSIPAEGAETPESVTVSGVTETGDDGYPLPAVYLPEDGASIVIRAKGDITLENSGTEPAKWDSKRLSNYGGLIIASSTTADADDHELYVSLSEGSVSRSGGLIDIESEGGVISLQRTDAIIAKNDSILSAPAVVLMNSEGSDAPLSYTLNGNETASRVSVQGGTYLSGPKITALINATGAGSTIWGAVETVGGASATLNLAGEGTVYSDIIPLDDLDDIPNEYRTYADGMDENGNPSRLTVNAAAGTTSYMSVYAMGGAETTINMAGKWYGVGGASGDDDDPVKSILNVNVSGYWDGALFIYCSGPVATVNLTGTWVSEEEWTESGDDLSFTVNAYGDLVNDPDHASTMVQTFLNVGSLQTLNVGGKWTGDLQLWEDDDGLNSRTYVNLGGFWSGSIYSTGGGETHVVLDKNAQWTYTGYDKDWVWVSRTRIDDSSTLTVKDDGFWQGAPTVLGNSLLDVTIGETGTWTYVLNTRDGVFNDPDDPRDYIGAQKAIDIVTASHTTTEVWGAAGSR